MSRAVWLLFLVLLCAPPGRAQSLAPPAGQAADTTAPERPSFEDWVAGVRAEALRRGISAATVADALDGLEPLPIVLDRDRTQAEHVLSLDVYLKRRVTARMIRTARAMKTRHQSLIRRVSAKYGAPSGIVIAIWGLESNFGRFSGVRPTIQALATLAYDPRRSDLFRRELFEALAILDEGRITPARLKGSWAGAMGQTQFLPSSYRQFAVDFDEDGLSDIWESLGDVFASIANYLAGHGWKASQRWGREVRVPSAAAAAVAAAAPLRTEGCRAVREMTEPRSLAQWREAGVTLPNARPLPAAPVTPVTDVPASLVRAGKRSFLVSDNYEALLTYNCAHAYALSVALLGDHVDGGERPKEKSKRQKVKGKTQKIKRTRPKGER